MDAKFRICRAGGWVEVAQTDDRDEADKLYDEAVEEFVMTERVVLWARRDGWNSGAGYGRNEYALRDTDKMRYYVSSRTG